jgi:Zn-dependent protease
MDMLTIRKIFIMTPILLIALPVHEFAHGWAALKMGDPTAKFAGRLTLNPFKHLDMLGVIMMYVAGFGWAKPVPVNSSYFRNRRMGIILVSLAGVTANLILAFLSMFITGIILKLVSVGVIAVDTRNALTAISLIHEFLSTLTMVNISLAVFNMIPVPPLDGSRVISAFFPEESYYRFAQYEQYIGLIFLLLVIFLPGHIFANIISFFALPIYNSMAQVTLFLLGL